MESTRVRTRKNEDLECGTSLVELEHASEVPFADRAVSSSDDSIDGLRDSIARDVSSGPFSSTGHRTFSSPFEAPLGSTPNSPSSARFMEVPLVYCDQTASNRPLTSIERYISDVCLPLYGELYKNMASIEPAQKIRLSPPLHFSTTSTKREHAHQYKSDWFPEHGISCRGAPDCCRGYERKGYGQSRHGRGTFFGKRGNVGY